MAHKVIFDARDLHGMQQATAQAYRKAHAQFVKRLGRRAEVHPAQVQAQARVDMGRWILDCECGAGVAILWLPNKRGLGLCYGCGAEHNLSPLPEREEIEAELVRRPQQRTRGWFPGETVDDLRRESAAHGV